MVIGIVRQPYGTILYRIKSSSREHLAPESELKLALGTERIGGIKSPEPLGGRSRSFRCSKRCPHARAAIRFAMSFHAFKARAGVQLPIGSWARAFVTAPYGYTQGSSILLRSRSSRSTALIERHQSTIRKSETTPVDLGGRHDPHNHIQIRALLAARYE
jgi:hypothetical protein